MIRSVAPKRIEPYLITLFYSIPRYSCKMKTLCLSFFRGVLVILKIVPPNCGQALPMIA